ncbi:MAG: hypothetical protein QOJ37_257 [Pseudonocardiales bacterium]|nr:hypothetical protein [Pseudonocardiales bacterium]
MLSWWSWRDRLAVLAGLVLPCAVCAALAPFRFSLPNTDAALVLVVAVVAVAANGHRLAGVVGSISAAVWFDFFLTPPYERFAINDRTDLETTLLLVVVGVAVTEIAVRGRRQRLLAQTDAAYLDAIESTTALVEAGAGPSHLTAHVSNLLTTLLGLRGCCFEATRFGGLPRLDPDGQLRVGDSEWDLDQYGMPERDIELLASLHGRAYGRFVLEPVAGLVAPVPARRCASMLASQVAAALAGQRRAA